MRYVYTILRVIVILNFVTSVLLVIDGVYDDMVNIALVFYCVLLILVFAIVHLADKSHRKLRKMVDDEYYKRM